ncbi:MAG TPA: metallophosphoesterase, partial [Rhodobacteraceae bacterium]|nr:metallophosphoesterase [Paracoccaceae bacterium]
ATLAGLFVETDDKTGTAIDVQMVRVGGRLQQSGPTG